MYYDEISRIDNWALGHRRIYSELPGRKSYADRPWRKRRLYADLLARQKVNNYIMHRTSFPVYGMVLDTRLIVCDLKLIVGWLVFTL